MTLQKQDFLVDQFGQPLQAGQSYGVVRGGAVTRAVVHECLMNIRGRVWLRGPDGSTLFLSNWAAGGTQFFLVDGSGRMVDVMPAAVRESHIEKARAVLEQCARRAAKLQYRQSDLIHDAAQALAGAMPAADLLDALSTFVRDADSHVTIETLIAAYAESLKTR